MTEFGARSTLRSAAAQRIIAAGLAFEATQRHPKLMEENRAAIERREAREAAGQEWAIPPPTIIQEVANKHGLRPRQLVGRDRARKVTAAKREAFYRYLTETEFSLPSVARFFNVDHTTVGYGAGRYAVLNDLPPPRGTLWKAATRKRHGGKKCEN